MISPTFTDQENVGKTLFRAVPGSSAEMGVLRSRLFQNKTFLHDPGNRSDLYIYKKQSAHHWTHYWGRSAPQTHFFFSLRAKPVLTPIASCQESAGTAQGQDLYWNQTCLNSPRVTWASHSRADIGTTANRSQASKPRTRVFKSKQKSIRKTN